MVITTKIPTTIVAPVLNCILTPATPAASVMYECSQRLSTEAATQDALKQQLKCYLACINCLKLLPKDMAWILKPTPAAAVDDAAATTNSGAVLGALCRSVDNRW